ncbi:MAG: hypothetical protein ACXWX0_03360, partial [Actinomycetota bacterium]
MTPTRTARLFVAMVASVILVGCSETGDPAEYDAIDAVSDCAELTSMRADYLASEEASSAAGNDGAAREQGSYAEAAERR